MCLCFPAAVGYCHTWVNLLYCHTQVCLSPKGMPISQSYACITEVCLHHQVMPLTSGYFLPYQGIPTTSKYLLPHRFCLPHQGMPDQVKPASPRYTHHKQVFSASEVKLAPSRYACLTKICMPHQDVQLSSTSSLSLQLVKPARAIKILPPGIIVG